DSDVTTFRNEVRAVARSIERLTHLHQPTTRDPQADDAVTTRVLTLTHSDGHEDHAVIHIADSDHNVAHAIATDAIAKARNKLGKHGERTLLAILAESVISGRDNDPDAKADRKKSTR